MNKRKLKWAFEGQDDDGNLEFTKSFVKLDYRPPFPYKMVADEKGGHAESIPGEVRLRQFVEKEEAISFFLEAAKRITKGTLRCLGGGFFLEGDQLVYEVPNADDIWEEWSFEGLEMRPQAIGEESQFYYADEGGFVIDWIVKYATSDYKRYKDLPLCRPDGGRDGSGYLM